MGKFDAGTAVDQMEYDFTAYGGGQGTIPEPSTGQVTQFFADMKDIVKEARGLRNLASSETPASEEDLAEAISDLDDGLMDRFNKRIAESTAQLCSGQPSPDDIQKLPFRVLAAFTAWIASEFRPEAQRPVMTR